MLMGICGLVTTIVIWLIIVCTQRELEEGSKHDLYLSGRIVHKADTREDNASLPRSR